MRILMDVTSEGKVVFKIAKSTVRSEMQPAKLDQIK